jgi:membrane protein DedA with SNARE-associated domain
MEEPYSSLEPIVVVPPVVSLTPPAPARPAPWLLTAAGCMVVATALGAGFAPYLAIHHPLWLIALSPLARHLILVAPHTELIPFLVLASVRGVLGCMICYELGRHYGPAGLYALDRRGSRLARQVRALEHLVGRYAWLLLLAAPSTLTGGLAGISSVPRLRVWSLSLIGFSVWAWVNRRVGGWLAPWTTPLLGFIREHALVLTALCSLIVLVVQVQQTRRKRASSEPAPKTE